MNTRILDGDVIPSRLDDMRLYEGVRTRRVVAFLIDYLVIALLLIPPFGASCVLVFGVPASPFARPQNVIGGHVISAAMGLAAVSLFGAGALGMAIGVGLAIASMMVSDTVHPPAGANPIVVALAAPGWSFLLAPVLAGAVVIVMLGAAYNRSRKRVGV